MDCFNPLKKTKHTLRISYLPQVFPILPLPSPGGRWILPVMAVSIFTNSALASRFSPKHVPLIESPKQEAFKMLQMLNNSCFLLRRCGWIGVFFDFQPRYLVLEALLMPANLSRPLKILPRSLKEITIAKIVGSIGHQGKIKVPPSRSTRNKTHSVADWK